MHVLTIKSKLHCERFIIYHKSEFPTCYHHALMLLTTHRISCYFKFHPCKAYNLKSFNIKLSTCLFAWIWIFCNMAPRLVHYSPRLLFLFGHSFIMYSWILKIRMSSILWWTKLLWKKEWKKLTINFLLLIYPNEFRENNIILLCELLTKK